MVFPRRLHPCGHTFCEDCVGDEKKRVKNKKCSICLETYYYNQKDFLASGLVDGLTVQCLNSDCPWKGSFSNYRNFHCNKCVLSEGIEKWLEKFKNTGDKNFSKDEENDEKNDEENYDYTEKKSNDVEDVP